MFDESQYDDEFDDGFEEGWDDGGEAIPCPHCGEEVYEYAAQCPHCRMYIIADTNMWEGKPIWWIILGVIGIIAVTFTLTMGT